MKAMLPKTVIGTFHLVLLVLVIPLVLALTAGSADRESIDAFHAAAGAGDTETVTRLLKADGDLLGAKDAAGVTPLHTASQAGMLDVVEVLVAAGAEVDAGDNENTTPLAVAALAGHLDVIEFLITKGADPLAADDNLATPFHWATYNGHLDVAIRLVELGADVHALKLNGSNALHGAAYGGHLDVVEYLIAEDSELNLQNQYGYTPVLLAAVGGHTEVLVVLVDAGASIDIWSDWQSPLHMAARGGNLETIKVLISMGADPNAKTEEAPPPLIAAIDSQNAEMVTFFLDNGADPNGGWASGHSALQYAVRNGNREIVETLIRRGADVNAEDENGTSALDVAVREGNAEMTGILIKDGATLNGKDPYFGMTPLQQAATAGNSEIVGMLLANGSSMNDRNAEGYTALDLATRYGHRDVAELLAAKGAESSKKVENFGYCQLLGDRLDEGEAILWYTGHCGWAVKTRNHMLIFDYWNRGNDPAGPCLANGHIDAAEIEDLNVTVFVTHEHRDHFDTTIFDWESQVDRIRYVYGFQPEVTPQYRQTRYNGPEYEYIGPRESTSVGDIKIWTIRANDAGVGFLIEVDGLTIYHAGDHAGWAEGEKQGYLDEIDYLAGLGPEIDMAFVNVTGCHAHNQDALREGTYYTLDKLSPKVVIPTHASGNEYRYVKAIEQAQEDGIDTAYAYPRFRGDRFIYSDGAMRQDLRDTSS